MKRATCVVLSLVASARFAAAESITEEAPKGPNAVTFSMSPVHLMYPFLELEAEFKAHPRVGVALILGGGTVTDQQKTISAKAYEVGVQLNYYVLQPFAGLHLGAETLYLTADDVMQDAALTAEGLSLGAYLGYKVQASFGLALIAQGGIQYMAARAENANTMASDSKVAALLNLNIGWSF